jgi:AbrB family looped-hinge helix DNA binding protein
MWANLQSWYNLPMSHRAQVTIGDRGRLVLPSSIRTALGLKPGSRLLLSTEEDGSLRLRPYRAVADQSRGLFAELSQTGSLVDELLAERRAEAERER